MPASQDRFRRNARAALTAALAALDKRGCKVVEKEPAQTLGDVAWRYLPEGRGITRHDMRGAIRAALAAAPDPLKETGM